MKRNALFALLLALLLVTGCGQKNSPVTDDITNTPDAPETLDTAALAALLETFTPEGAVIVDVRDGDGMDYPADGALRAEDYLTALRDFHWTAFRLPSYWDGSSTGSYRLTADGAELTLYWIDNAAVLRAVTADGQGWFTVPYREDMPSGETQYSNLLLSETVRDWYDGAEAAARYASDGTPLTGEELTHFEAYTASSRTEGDVTYATPIACFFTSTYRNVRDLDAAEFLRYCPSEGSVSNADGEEARLVAEKLDWRGNDGQRFTVDDLPTPCHRIPRAYLDGILTEYAGVTVEEMYSDWTAELFYLPETDCFYTFTSDFGPGVFRPAYGERSGDTVRLWTNCAENRCLTLKQDGEGWHILSHRQSGALFDDGELYGVAYLGYGEAGDLTYYREAFGLADELPTYRVSGGDFYLIVPRYEDMRLALYQNDMESGERSLLHEEAVCRPFLLECNVSDIFPDATVVLTRGDEAVEFSPFVSLKDGHIEVGARGADLTRGA